MGKRAAAVKEELPSWPADNPERVRIADLKPYPRNPRTHTPAQIEQIAASMRAFNVITAIVIDENDMILAGHGRVMAATKLGFDEIPAVRLYGLSPAQKMALVIADNKIPDNAGWDDELLKLELGELKRLDFDLDLTGFDADQLVSYLAEPNFQPGTEEDQVRLDEFSPMQVRCPHCGGEFNGREHAKK